MNGNIYELIGRVNYLSLKALNNGNTLTRVLLSIKRYKSDDYDTFPVTFFGDTSEDIADKVKKGDYIHVTGRLNLDKYKSKEGKDVENLSLIGNTYEKVTFDKDKKQFVVVEGDIAPKATQQTLVEEMFG